MAVQNTYSWGLSYRIGLQTVVSGRDEWGNFPNSYKEEVRRLFKEIANWVDPSIDTEDEQMKKILKSPWRTDLGYTSRKICEQAQRYSKKSINEMDDIIYTVFYYIEGLRYATNQYDYDKYLYEKMGGKKTLKIISITLYY